MAELSEDARRRALLAELLKYPNAQRDRKYYEALGRFVIAYARAEIQVHVLMRHYSTAQDEQARIMLHRLGLTKATNLLRELMQSQIYKGGILQAIMNEHTYNEVDSCLGQLAIISGKRGDLVHRSSLTSDAGFELSNAMTAKQLASYEQGVISLTDLEAMLFDCGIIFLRLHRISHPVENDIPDPLWLRGPPTWRYKLPPQAPPKEPRMKARKARKIQRRTLREKQTVGK